MATSSTHRRPNEGVCCNLTNATSLTNRRSSYCNRSSSLQTRFDLAFIEQVFLFSLLEPTLLRSIAPRWSFQEPLPLASYGWLSAPSSLEQLSSMSIILVSLAFISYWNQCTKPIIRFNQSCSFDHCTWYHHRLLWFARVSRPVSLSAVLLVGKWSGVGRYGRLLRLHGGFHILEYYNRSTSLPSRSG